MDLHREVAIEMKKKTIKNLLQQPEDKQQAHTLRRKGGIGNRRFLLNHDTSQLCKQASIFKSNIFTYQRNANALVRVCYPVLQFF